MNLKTMVVGTMAKNSFILKRYCHYERDILDCLLLYHGKSTNDVIIFLVLLFQDQYIYKDSNFLKLFSGSQIPQEQLVFSDTNVIFLHF